MCGAIVSIHAHCLPCLHHFPSSAAHSIMVFFLKGVRVHQRENKRAHTYRDRKQLTARRNQEPPRHTPLPSTSSTPPGRKKASSPRTEANGPNNLVEMPQKPSDAGAGICSINEPRLRAAASSPSPSPAGDKNEDATPLSQSRPSPPVESLPSSNSHEAVLILAGLQRG